MAGTGRRRQKSDLLETAERRAFIFKLRRAGVTYREIAERAIEKFGLERLPQGWNDLYACKDVGRELDRLRTELNESVKDLRNMQDERLNDLFVSLWPQAMRGHQGAVDRVLRIMDRRAKLWGLDKQKPSEAPPVNISFDMGDWLSQRKARLDKINQLEDVETQNS
jgi:hypothetical protein